jgi:hypothetical protein
MIVLIVMQCRRRCESYDRHCLTWRAADRGPEAKLGRNRTQFANVNADLRGRVCREKLIAFSSAKPQSHELAADDETSTDVARRSFKEDPMKYASILSLAVAVMGLVGSADAGHGCNQCGCNQGRKVCKLVPSVTKTTTFEYSCKCEDICLNGRSKCIGTQQVRDCDGCVKCEKVMQPTCCQVKSITKLVKTPVTKEKHGWKCVVVQVCGGCRQCAEAREATEVETQLAITEATKQGLLVNFEQEVTVSIPDNDVAPAAAEVVTVSEKKPSTNLFSKLFGK